MQHVRWGIIGCGDVTEVKSGPAFRKIPNSSLVHVMRRDAAKAEDYANRHGVPKHTSDAATLIADPEVDAVYIATPPGSHCEYTLRAAAAGKPVYVEKPMALNHKECQQMIAACKSANVPLFVAYYRRRLPHYVKIRDIIKQGLIGDVRLVNMRLYHPPKEGDQSNDLQWRVRPEISGGGHFFDLGAHQLDYLDYLFGSVTSVHGIAGNQAGFYPAEDVVAATFRFENHVLATGIWCFTVDATSRLELTEIIGTKGKVTFSFFDQQPVVLDTAQGSETINLPQPEHVQQPLIETIVAELTGKGTCPSTGESGARTSKVLEDVVLNYYKS